MRCKHILSLHTPKSVLAGLFAGSAALAAASLAHVQPAAAAATETVLHEFKGGSDGANPHAGLTPTARAHSTELRGAEEEPAVLPASAAAPCSSSRRQPQGKPNGPRRFSIASRAGAMARLPSRP
jgi:hypothetical protein